MRVVQAARFLGSVLGLCCNAGGGAGCFVGEAKTIVLSIKLRWRNKVDLNGGHRFSSDTEMTTLDIS